jgi:hypothetical protein
MYVQDSTSNIQCHKGLVSRLHFEVSVARVLVLGGETVLFLDKRKKQHHSV